MHRHVAVRAAPRAQGADAGLLLGQVDQVEIDAEGADQGPQVLEAELAEPVAEPPGGLGRGVGAEVLRRGADLLDERERVLAREPPDGPAEQVAEEMDVAAERFERLWLHERPRRWPALPRPRGAGRIGPS